MYEDKNIYKAKVLVAQLGARKHYQEPVLFHRWGILDRLYTDFYLSHTIGVSLLRQPKFYNNLPSLIRKVLDRYDFGLKDAKIIHFPSFSYQYMRTLKQAQPEQASQIFVRGGQEFCERIVKYGLGNANTVYGFNSASLELFKYAKKRGIRCILDQTLVDYSLVHQLLLEEEKRYPEWSLTPFQVSEADFELMHREHLEQDLADHIICGSRFVKDSLIARGVDANKISVVPLGRLKDVSPIQFPPVTQTAHERGDRLRILFIGSVGLRKGIPYLLEALRKIQGEIPFTCKIAGSLEIKSQHLTEYGDVCDFLGRVSRSQVKELYTWADVFVLPSICEGSAMVTYEALSMGVPVITTYNSGSVVRDGIDGFVLPTRDVKCMVDKLLTIYTGGYQPEKHVNLQDYLDRLFLDSEHKLLQIVDEIS